MKSDVDWTTIVLLAVAGPLVALAFAKLVEAGADPWLLGKVFMMGMIAFIFYLWEKEEKQGRGKN